MRFYSKKFVTLLIYKGLSDNIRFMMKTNITENTYEKLQIENTLLKQKLEQLQGQLEVLQEFLRLATHNRFGASSEKHIIPEQLSLFSVENEKASLNASELPPKTEKISYTRRKKMAFRKDQISNLPIETVEYRLPDEEQICECCKGELHEMSKEVRVEVKVVPAQVKAVEHITYIYGCRNCEKKNTIVPIKKAKSPNPALPGSVASSSAIAYIMSQKFVESMPLYRLEKHFMRMGIEFSRQTMSNWMINVSERWLSLLYEHMKKELLKLNIIHCDETTLQVLKEPGREPQSKSYMWLYRSGRYGPPIVLYEYKPSRAGACPKKFLEGFIGHIHVDGYRAYNKVANARLSACWAHARRMFLDALKALPKNFKSESQSAIVSHKGLEYCNSMFEIERLLKDETPEVRFIERLRRSKPILDEFKKWLDYNLPRTLSGGPAGKAIKYCLNIWENLYVFLENGMLEIDNNRAERTIKSLVIGRKNFMFCNTQRGANACAVIYSIVESAKEAGLNPMTYLTYLFDVMPNLAEINDVTLLKIVPWSDLLPDFCKVPSVAD